MNNTDQRYIRSSELLAFVSVALTGSLIIFRLMIGLGAAVWSSVVLIGIALYLFKTFNHWQLKVQYPKAQVTPDLLMLGPLALSVVLSGFFFASVTFLMSLELIFSLNYGNPFKPELSGCLIFFVAFGAIATGVKAYKGMKRDIGRSS